jgi:hypothetical protein
VVCFPILVTPRSPSRRAGVSVACGAELATSATLFPRNPGGPP